MKRNALAAGAAALFIPLAACGSSSEPTGTTSPTAGAIVISSSAYTGSLTVKPGQEVIVTNMDPMPHTLTNTRTALFSTGTIKPGGGTGTFTAPTKPGSYPFWCLLHTVKMQNTLLVQG